MLNMPAHADIYKCADETGQVAFADGKTKAAYTGCKIVMRDESSPIPRTYSANNNSRTATPVDFPRVDRQTQMVRDDKRKQILLSELETEQKALQEAKKTYVENTAQASLNVNTKIDERFQRLLADVDSHEKNIQLLHKELGTLR